MHEVYLATNVINGKIYVGKTSFGKENRWRGHVSEAKKGERSRLNYAILKHGEENFFVTFLEEARTEEENGILERIWIFLLGSKNPSIGYNMTDGGEGSSGLKHRPDAGTREKGKHSGEKNGRYREDVSTEEIVSLYIDGKSSVQIAQKLSVNKTLVLKRLKEAKVPRRDISDSAKMRMSNPRNNPAFRSDVSMKKIVRLYHKGLSYRKIAALVGLSDTCVMDRLRKQGLSCPVKNSKMEIGPESCLDNEQKSGPSDVLRDADSSLLSQYTSCEPE